MSGVDLCRSRVPGESIGETTLASYLLLISFTPPTAMRQLVGGAASLESVEDFAGRFPHEPLRALSGNHFLPLTPARWWCGRTTAGRSSPVPAPCGRDG